MGEPIEKIPIVVKEFTKDDFLETTEPFDFAYQYESDPFQLERVLSKLSEQASAHKLKNFKTLYKSFAKGKKKQSNIASCNVTNFTGQHQELISAEWTADDLGVSCLDMFGKEQYACVHPISIKQRLTNIDTGTEKLKLVFARSFKWREIIVDKKAVSSNNKIVDLSDSGIAVTTENSKLLVKYLHDLEHENYEAIDEKKCCSRLGWIAGEGFAPYVSKLEFDGDVNFKSFFESVSQKGELSEWAETVKSARKFNITAKIILASSFASVLVGPLKSLPFFVHLWGTTEVGKTVGLMLAASVWANPEVGKFIHSFNSTAVGRERAAAFVNSLPLILDELELVKDKKQFDQDVYMLCEGSGKARGNKAGGMDKTPTWKNCILTSGERPLTSGNSGGGASNRIIEIQCDNPLFKDPREFCNVVQKNHGHAGKKFVEHLQQDGAIDEAKLIFKKHLDKLSEVDTTQKQALSMALILTADEIISKLFFDNEDIKMEEITEFLKSKESVSSGQRAYEFLCGWVSQNANNFSQDKFVGELYGKFLGGRAYIIKTIFDRVLESEGLSGASVLSYLKKNNLIEYKNRDTITARIMGQPTRCVSMKMIDGDGID